MTSHLNTNMENNISLRTLLSSTLSKKNGSVYCPTCNISSVLIKHFESNVNLKKTYRDDYRKLLEFKCSKCKKTKTTNIAGLPLDLNDFYSICDHIDEEIIWKKLLDYYFELLKSHPVYGDVNDIIPLVLIRLGRDKDAMTFIKYWMHALTGWIDNNDVESLHRSYTRNCAANRNETWIYNKAPRMFLIDSPGTNMFLEIPFDFTVTFPLSFLLAMSTIQLKIIVKYRFEIFNYECFCRTDFGDKLEQVHSVIKEFAIESKRKTDEIIAKQLDQIESYFYVIQGHDVFLPSCLLMKHCPHKLEESGVHMQKRLKMSSNDLTKFYLKHWLSVLSSLEMANTKVNDIFRPSRFAEYLHCERCAQLEQYTDPIENVTFRLSLNGP